MKALSVITLGIAVAAAGTAFAADAGPQAERARLQALFTQQSAAPVDRSSEIAAWQKIAVSDPYPGMAVASPHAAVPSAMVAKSDAAVEKRRQADLVKWAEIYSRDPYPEMGLGGHSS